MITSYSLIAIWCLVLFVLHHVLKMPIAWWVAELSAIGIICLSQVPVLFDIVRFIRQYVRRRRQGYPSPFDERLARELELVTFLQAFPQRWLLDLEERLLIEVEISKYLVEGASVMTTGVAAVLAAYIAVKGGVFIAVNSSTFLNPSVVCLALLLPAIIGCLTLAGDRHVMRRLAWAAHVASRNGLENFSLGSRALLAETYSQTRSP